MANDVLAVAVVGAVKDWAVYIGAAAGNNHDIEAMGVARNGAKLPESVAKAIFPHWKGLRYRL